MLPSDGRANVNRKDRPADIQAEVEAVNGGRIRHTRSHEEQIYDNRDK